MSVKHALLALLDQGPQHGYGLKHEFEARLGQGWPLNVGQVYTTLDRLERDGFVVQDGDPDADGRIAYRLTDSGHAEVRTWFTSPVSAKAAPRDELAIKLALAVTTPGVDVVSVVQTQRSSTMTALQELTRLKVRASAEDLAWSLVLDSLVFRAEAEIRWLDHCETRVARAAASRPVASATSLEPMAPAPATAQKAARR